MRWKKKLGIYEQMQRFFGECNGFVKVLLVNAMFPRGMQHFCKSTQKDWNISHILLIFSQETLGTRKSLVIEI